MDMNPASLIASLYARAQTATEAPAAAPDHPAGPDLLARASDFMARLKNVETTVVKGLTGSADPQSVVMALAATELAVETAVTLRDKVVEAYQEILRMPV